MKVVHFISKYRDQFICRYYEVNESGEKKLCKETFSSYQLALDFIWLLENNDNMVYLNGSKPFKKQFPGE